MARDKTEPPPHSAGVASRIAGLIFVVAPLALYGYSVASDVGVMDAGEFAGVAASLGVAHPTGYPLLALLGRLFTFAPWGTVVFRVGLVSAAAGSLATFFLYLAVTEVARGAGLNERATLAGAAAAGLVALTSRTLWSLAAVPEVYALNGWLWAALLWAALRLRRTGLPRDLYGGAFLAGLALGNHLTIIIFFPCAAVIAWPGKRRARALAPALFGACALLVLGVSVNLYTPLRAAQFPLYDWNHPATAGALVQHLGAAQYRGRLGAGGAAAFKATLSEFGRGIPANATWAAVLALAAAVWLGGRGRRLVGWGFMLYVAAFLAFCGAYYIPDIRFYFLPAYLAVAFLSGVGMAAAIAWFGGRRPLLRRAATAVTAAGVVAAAGVAFAGNMPSAVRRPGLTFGGLYGRSFLQALPFRTLLFSSDDTTANVAWFNVYVRRVRPDVAVVDQVRLISAAYREGLARRHPDIVLPDEKRVGALAAAYGDARGGPLAVRSSDDFILPALVEDIILANAPSRPLRWGAADPGTTLRRYLYPADLTLEVAPSPPAGPSLKARAAAATRAYAALATDFRRLAPAERRDPFVKETFRLYGWSLAEHLGARGRLESEADIYAAYLRVFPDDAEIYGRLGAVYHALNQPARAAEYYRRALALNPRDTALAAVFRRVAARAGVEGPSPAGETPGEAAFLRGIRLREQRRIPEALVAFAAAEEYCAGDAGFWWEWGSAYDAAGDAAAARDCFTKGISVEPGRAYLYTGRGVEYLKLKDEDAARADFERAVALNAADAQAHYNLACIYARRRQTPAALEHLAAAFRLGPDHYVELAERDADLVRVRETPAYERLVREYAPSGGAETP